VGRALSSIAGFRFPLYFLLLFILLHQTFNTSCSMAWEPPPVSGKVFQFIVSEYGVDAESRMRYLSDLIHDNHQLPIEKKLDLVNRTMNRLPWIADERHWKKNRLLGFPTGNHCHLRGRLRGYRHRQMDRPKYDRRLQ
jgi:hypothetical protein